MRTTRDLSGLAIIDIDGGKKLGSVGEVVISPDDGRLLGFVIKSGGLLKAEESVVEIDDVRSIGADAITVAGDEIIHRTEASGERFQAARAGDRALIGRKVVTQGGSVLGQVADLVLSEESRRVVGLVLGSGMFERGDAVPADRVAAVGPDVVIVTDADTASDDPGPFTA